MHANATLWLFRASWLSVAINVISVGSRVLDCRLSNLDEHHAIVTSIDNEKAKPSEQSRHPHAMYVHYVLRKAHAQ